MELFSYTTEGCKAARKFLEETGDLDKVTKVGRELDGWAICWTARKIFYNRRLYNNEQR